jgi:hypothetical protein
MAPDNQHLEFLISQYVDQTLDAPNRKLIEQQITGDPVAGRLYQEQRDVQEVLDEWGNRLPLINWDEFDRTLAQRLAHEVPSPAQPVRVMRPWGKGLATAAALFVAATLGYTWHAMTVTPQVAGVTHPQGADPSSPLHAVTIDRPAATGPSMDTVSYEQPAVAFGTGKVQFQKTPGSNKLPLDHIAVGFHPGGNHTGPAGSVVGSAVERPAKSDHADTAPSNF